jgi:hypothetical protein
MMLVCAPEMHQDSTGNLSFWQAFRIVNPLLSDTRIGVLYLKPFGVCGCSAMYFHHIIIYLWSGTCDLTCKKGKYISLRHQNNKTVNCILDQYHRAIRIVVKHPRAEIKFIDKRSVL